jgi:hypothetical protein
MLHRNISTADCQKSGGEGKTLDEKRPPLRKFGYRDRVWITAHPFSETNLGR